MQRLLENYRIDRNFNSKKYIDAKSKLLNEYMKRTGLSGAVIGVSGGIDSATTLAIIAYAANCTGSPIKKIVAVMAPQFVDGTTEQFMATFRANNLIDSFNRSICCHVNIDKKLIDLTSTHSKMFNNSAYPSSAWSSGQLVSYIRTPALYYIGSILYEMGYPSLICGTTNLDEGGYIGYFGKASDGMVDIQLISDIHKSEVYKVAHQLNVTDEIINVKPSGDLYNGLTDEEYIGVPYDYIELYVGYLMGWVVCLPIDPLCNKWNEIIENLHKQCSHKYHGTGYAIHLDVYNTLVPGGWSKCTPRVSPEPDKSRFVNLVDLQLYPCTNSSNVKPRSIKTLKVLDDYVRVADGLLDKRESENIINMVNRLDWIPTGYTGRIDEYKLGDKIGSYRLSVYDEKFAEIIWNRIKTSVDHYIIHDQSLSTDSVECPVWKAVGINPLFRFIKYQDPSNKLVPHYDAPYDYLNGRKTLQSCIIYLTDCHRGATRFLADSQARIPILMRDLSDKKDKLDIDKRDVLLEIDCEAGRALIFNHRILHDTDPSDDDFTKIIMRTDIIFEQCLPVGMGITQPLNFDKNLMGEKYDKFYTSALKVYTSKQLKDAGYTLIHRQKFMPTNWLSTPYYKILKNFNNIKTNYGEYGIGKLYVLVGTGCYDPIHPGHINLMDAAYECLTMRYNKLIVGGYLVPAHTKYVIEKNGTDSPLKRLSDCQKCVLHHEWLSVDPHELLYETNDVNYTQIILRLEEYLQHHIGPNIRVVYVCGSDHATFARMFVGHGTCICVSRPGYEKIYNEMKAELEGNENIYWCGQTTVNMCSTDIRKIANNVSQSTHSSTRPQVTFCQPQVTFGQPQVTFGQPQVTFGRPQVTFGRPQVTFGRPQVTFGPSTYQLRNECIDLPEYNELCHTIKKLFEDTFKNNSIDIDVNLIDLNDQIDAIRGYDKKEIISLDPIISTGYTLGLSRLFGVAYPGSCLSVISRPGMPSVESQIKKIPKGSYYLMDDDTVSGLTIETAKSYLGSEIKIKNIILLSKNVVNGLDISDCRDFLIGSPFGGLVIELPNGNIARVPYALPYVFPSDRCMTPVEDDLKFSIKIWQINLCYYLKNPTQTANVDINCQKLLHYIGFTNNYPMAYICLWHLMQLT